MNRSYNCSSRWHMNHHHHHHLPPPPPSPPPPPPLPHTTSINQLSLLFSKFRLEEIRSDYVCFVSLMKTKKEDITRGLKFGGAQKKDDLMVRVGNKVLPVNESTTPRFPNPNPNPSPDVKKEKGDRTKTVSRMIELLRWAAAAKSEKGGKYIARKVSQFRNRTTFKSIQDVDQMTNESPKISFRWELESCSTFSSALSISSTNQTDQNVNIEIHSNPDDNSSLVTLRSGNWITSDSDCKSLQHRCGFRTLTPVWEILKHLKSG